MKVVYQCFGDDDLDNSHPPCRRINAHSPPEDVPRTKWSAYCRFTRPQNSNTAAVLADEKYLAKNGAKNFYSFYRLHKYHSLLYAAMLAGQSKVALRTLDQMESSLTDDVLRVKTPPLADWLEFFKAVRIHVYIRFGL
ncbi:hypothetical protein BDV33DRAFT_206461 [Aspergillus novoparasiticus]|uniref:Uncharacterized protein n=1 Tax=Aspergillus novoparasiticus TaxID=986946 RepID=A0A5N6EKA3_9EURO|nr:hypothetical protein BDV33DRAFT_206461 [Aspergillus novoparasiticus]